MKRSADGNSHKRCCTILLAGLITGFGSSGAVASLVTGTFSGNVSAAFGDGDIARGDPVFGSFSYDFDTSLIPGKGVYAFDASKSSYSVFINKGTRNESIYDYQFNSDIQLNKQLSDMASGIVKKIIPANNPELRENLQELAGKAIDSGGDLLAMSAKEKVFNSRLFGMGGFELFNKPVHVLGIKVGESPALQLMGLATSIQNAPQHWFPGQLPTNLSVISDPGKILGFGFVGKGGLVPTMVSGTGFLIDKMTIVSDSALVPIPAPILLLLSGIVALLGLARRGEDATVTG